MKAFVNYLDLLYPDTKWYDKKMIKNAYRNFLKDQLLDMFPLRGRTQTDEGIIKMKVSNRFSKWNGKIVRTTMRANNDGLTTIYCENKVDHIHAKFLKPL